MKNPYSLYHLEDDDSTPTQKKLSISVQRKVTRMINLIVEAAKKKTITVAFVEEQDQLFLMLSCKSGVQDTASREAIVSVMERKLVDKAGLSKKEAGKWANIWW